MLYYQLAYCVDCCIPVYWLCLPESTPVQRVTISGNTYLVFRCDACLHKKANPESEKPSCRECKHSEGYLKKIVPITKSETETIEPGFVHPCCALSFPNIYQMGSPVNMSIKICSGIELSEIEKVPGPAPVCDICETSTPRML